MTSPREKELDRTFLEDLQDNYLKALIAHDPSRLPLSGRIKYTENTIELPLGDGLWATASDDATYRLYVCDPQGGQVGFYGLMKENGFPIIIASRLKTEEGLITEIENIVVRSDGLFVQVENLVKPRPVFLETLSSLERVPREEMIRIPNLYFDALETDDGDIVPWGDGCERVENGTQTTNNPNIQLPGSSSSFNPIALGAREQINSKSFIYITEIKPRRYTVIDEERGLTFGTFMFHHAGNINFAEVPEAAGVEMIPSARRPFTVAVSELFKVKNGKIMAIEANMISLPYRAGSGWDD